MNLKPESLEFYRGNSSFTKEEFIDAVAPFMSDLTRVGRTNFLCAFQYGDGTVDVTGYSTDATINATVNDRCVESEKTGGKWVIYRTVKQ